MMAPPVELQLRYTYVAASMPPPAHDEYIIDITGDGKGCITFWPDYTSHNPPVWKESFTLSDKSLTHLLALLKSKVLAKRFATRPPGWVGDSQRWLEGSLEGQPLHITTGLTPAAARRAEVVYTCLHDLVPEEIWQSLRTRQEHFQRHYKD
jgi:hypothetical protein